MRKVVDVGFLSSYDAVGEVDDTVDRESVGRFYFIERAGGFVFETERLWDGKLFALSILLNGTHSGDLQHPRACRAVENRHFAAVKFNKSVVNLAAMKGRHEVFDSGDAVASGA